MHRNKNVRPSANRIPKPFVVTRTISCFFFLAQYWKCWTGSEVRQFIGLRVLPSFSLSTLGQLAGPPAIRWPDCCSSGWPVSTSRTTVLHFPKTSGNTVVHLRYDQQMFSIGDFDLSFLIQGVQGGFSITTSTTPRQSTARHRAKHRVMSHSANLCPASDSIYLILLCGISAPNRFCIIQNGDLSGATDGRLAL